MRELSNHLIKPRPVVGRTVEIEQGRNPRVGDIINSSPYYSKESNTIFIGANDGMLHAFNATSGAEVFAYVPGKIDLTALKSLASDNYAHSYFVDGVPGGERGGDLPGEHQEGEVPGDDRAADT